MAESADGPAQFSRLPPEIQVMIWKEVLETPQIVQMCFDWDEYNGTGAVRHRVVPPALQVCALSRRLALQVYTDRFYEEQIWTLVVTYLQPGVDVLYYGSVNRGDDFDSGGELWAYGEFPTLDPSLLKHLAVEVNYWLEQDAKGDMVHSTRMLIGLKTLTLVVEDDKPDPAVPAALVDLTDEEHRSLLGTYAPSAGFGTSAELLRKIRDDFVTRFDLEDISHDYIPNMEIKRLKGNILGKISRRSLDSSSSSPEQSSSE
ncbi:hypothetical protein O9K51_02983 [Purpureocillium lavendulum]|uniref:2EXR domain-containing protein n=1 Tax=Purpureocillium lavendulum TaxID=1247861 RepID=A0AB34G0M1_9HYPO|nr:hypothetical protein O9K51_02983 [Purpureocillium lavendulum]